MMTRRRIGLILALAFLAATAPRGKAQTAGSPPAGNPSPNTVPGPAANPASEPEMISVALLNRIPDVDRGNLREYWPVVEGRTKELWMQRLPRQAKPPLSDAGEVKIICWLHTDGRVTSMMLEQPSGNVALDRAAWAAITGSVPYDAFPYGISVNQVRVRFTFTYNQESGGSPVNGKPGLAGTKPRSLAK